MNPNCPRCGAGCSIKYGRYRRAEDAQKIQRFQCRECKKLHSSATHCATYRQKRRRLNPHIEKDICSGVSQRRMAINHGCARQTVARKIEFLAQQCRLKTQKLLTQCEKFEHVQFDELITFEHSRLKPLSVAVMSVVGVRCILGFGVAQIPMSGVVAKHSRDKYGKRQDLSGAMRRKLLKSVATLLTDDVLIETDEHTRYADEIKSAAPRASHVTHPSLRGSLTAQGELKRTGHDPLFPINHTLAMLRDNIKRLARRTWCTTKKVSTLEDILAIYVHFHNTRLIPRIGPDS